MITFFQIAASTLITLGMGYGLITITTMVNTMPAELARDLLKLSVGLSFTKTRLIRQAMDVAALAFCWVIGAHIVFWTIVALYAITLAWIAVLYVSRERIHAFFQAL